MNRVFKQFLRKFVLIFFDDILIYSPAEEAHYTHLRQVLEVLRDNQLFAKRSKCSFFQTSLQFLGHIISGQGVSPDPEKLIAIKEWSIPGNIRALRGFLGLTGYYRKFVKGYATIAAPMTNLLKKDAFEWNDEATESFNQLKKTMMNTPVLAHPDFAKEFCLETDASQWGIGAVLMQEGHPIAFFSAKLGERMQLASTYAKEMHVIVQAVGKWRHYLLGNHFVINTDHHSIKNMLTQVIQTPDQQVSVAITVINTRF